VTGFEPATSSSRTKHATKLRHTPSDAGSISERSTPAEIRYPGTEAAEVKRSAAVRVQIHKSQSSNGSVRHGRIPSFYISRNERRFSLTVIEISRSRPSASNPRSRHTRAASPQLTGFAQVNGVPPVSAFCPGAFHPIEDHIALRAGQWSASEVLSDLRIRVDLDERGAVSRLPGSQDQPSGLDPGRFLRGHGAVSVSSDASGGQPNRTGAYGDVPRPADTCNQDETEPLLAG
jgi:hypothetical protein